MSNSRFLRLDVTGLQSDACEKRIAGFYLVTSRFCSTNLTKWAVYFQKALHFCRTNTVLASLKLLTKAPFTSAGPEFPTELPSGREFTTSFIPLCNYSHLRICLIWVSKANKMWLLRFFKLSKQGSAFLSFIGRVDVLTGHCVCMCSLTTWFVLTLIFPQMYRILFFWILEECKSQSFSLWGVQSSKNNVSVGGLGGRVYPASCSVRGLTTHGSMGTVVL